MFLKAYNGSHLIYHQPLALLSSRSLFGHLSDILGMQLPSPLQSCLNQSQMHIGTDLQTTLVW